MTAPRRLVPIVLAGCTLVAVPAGAPPATAAKPLDLNSGVMKYQACNDPAGGKYCDDVAGWTRIKGARITQVAFLGRRWTACGAEVQPWHVVKLKVGKNRTFSGRTAAEVRAGEYDSPTTPAEVRIKGKVAKQRKPFTATITLTSGGCTAKVKARFRFSSITHAPTGYLDRIG